MRDEAKAEIVRRALRAYLDEQEDLLSSRKHFTKMFQRRVTYIERLLAISLWLNVQTLQILFERVKKEPQDLGDLLAEAVQSGIETEDQLYTLVEIVLRQNTKPPASLVKAQALAAWLDDVSRIQSIQKIHQSGRAVHEL